LWKEKERCNARRLIAARRAFFTKRNAEKKAVKKAAKKTLEKAAIATKAAKECKEKQDIEQSFAESSSSLVPRSYKRKSTAARPKTLVPHLRVMFGHPKPDSD
jgi:hypothetical protein